MIQEILNKIRKYFESDGVIIAGLILLKIIFQVMIVRAGYMWLSSDDFCRTVKSYEWLERPVIEAGVWLTPHFWVNGMVMLFVKDLFWAATLTNVIFSGVTVYFFYKLVVIVFDRKTGVISTLIFIFFPFQVWLSLSGLPESIHFFFIIAGIYYSVLYKRYGGKFYHLIPAALMFFFGNMFRYEGWLFSVVFVIFVFYVEIVLRKKGERRYSAFAVSLFSLSSIGWWLFQNYIDTGSMFFFAAETNKIYEEYGGIRSLQKIVQYPVFIFYIAPITSFFAVKVSYDCIRGFLRKKDDVSLLLIFAFFNTAELVLLMAQGLLGTGGTNMISRYIVINAVLYVPMAVWQIFNFRKWAAVVIFGVILAGNMVWSFNFPNPFREDTYETGRLIRDRIERNYVRGEERVYFEEVEGYYDVFAVQTISNFPSRFILGNFPVMVKNEEKKKRKDRLSSEELNILDIKSYLEKNKVALAVVKSDSYAEKLRRLNFESEEIGDYKIFYIKGVERNISDSIVVLADKVVDLREGGVNFNRTLVVKQVVVDNTNFGFNPQTVSIKWASATRSILDSIDYENFDFDRYSSVVEIRREDNDSLVYSETKRIFSERNVEDLLAYNEVKNIIVIKPFALIYYSRKYLSSPFESGVYSLYLKVYDGKRKRALVLYKGDSLYKSEQVLSETDSVKVKQRGAERRVENGFKVGSVIAFFPNTNLEKLVGTDNASFYRVITKNGLQVFFSQRHQADHFLNFVFNYF